MTYTAVTGGGQSNGGTGDALPVSITPGTIGNFILAQVIIQQTGHTVTALSASNINWSPLTPGYNGSTNTGYIRTFIGVATGAGAASTSATYTGGTPTAFSGVVYQVFSSTTGTPVLDNLAHQDVPNGSTIIWPNIVAARPGELYWGYCLNAGSAASGTTSGYVYSPNADAAGNGAAYNLSVGPGTVTGPTWGAGDPGENFGEMVLVAPFAGTAFTPLASHITPLSSRFGPNMPFRQPPLLIAVSGAAIVPISDTDTGSGAEASSINATLSGAETSSGADNSTSIGLSNPETGTGTDTGVTIGLSQGETGTSSDTGGVDVLGADTGAGADASSIAATLSDTDTGSGAEASTVDVLGSDTGSGTDAGEKISLTTTDTGTGTDTGSSIGLSGGETGSGSDTSGVDVLGSDTGAGAEANTLTANVPGSETGSGADASTSIGLSNPDTGTGTDGNGSVAVLTTDSDTGSGADALSTLKIVPASQETGTGAEASSINATLSSPDTGAGAEAATIGLSNPDTGTGTDASTQIGLTTSDTGSGAEAGQIGLTTSDTGAGAEAGQIGLSAPDTGTGTDTGSSIGLSGGETGSGSDTSGVDVLGSDTSAGADNSTNIGVSTSDTGGSSDSTFINATLSSSDTASGVDGGENIGTTNAPHDADTGFFGDSEIFTVPGGAGTQESGGAASEAASLALAQADSGTSAEAAIVLITGSVFLASSDVATAADSPGVGAGPRSEFETGTAVDAQRISMPPTSDTDAGSLDDEVAELHVWAALPPDPHPGGGYGVVFGRGTKHHTLLMRADRLSLPLLKYAQMIREHEASGGTLLRIDDGDGLAGQDVQDKAQRVELSMFLGDQGQSIIVQARAASNGTWLRPQLQLEGPGGAAELRGGLLIHPVHGYVTAYAPASPGSWTARAVLPGTDAVAVQVLTISGAITGS